MIGLNQNRRYCINSEDFTSGGYSCGEASGRDRCENSFTKLVEEMKRKSDDFKDEAKRALALTEHQLANYEELKQQDPNLKPKKQLELRRELAQESLILAEEQVAQNDLRLQDALKLCIGDQNHKDQLKLIANGYQCESKVFKCSIHNLVPRTLNYLFCPNDPRTCSNKIVEPKHNLDFGTDEISVASFSMNKLKEDKLCSYIIKAPNDLPDSKLLEIKVNNIENVRMVVY